MQRAGSIVIIGVVLILMPLLGFPSGWKNFLSVALGLWLCYIVFAARRRHAHSRGHKRGGERAKRDVPAPTPSSTFASEPAASSDAPVVSPSSNDEPPQI